jgi:hypothetical protein
MRRADSKARSIRAKRVSGSGAGPRIVEVADAGGPDLVRERVPVVARVIDDDRGDGLRHDALEDLLDGALAREPFGAARVVGLDLVAEVPVREQAHLRGEEAAPLRVNDVVHPDVVARDVALGLGRRARVGEVDLGGYARRELLREPRLGPLAARPALALALAQPLFERRQREVEEGDERDLRLEEVFGEVRRRVVAREEVVEGEDGAEFELRLRAELAADLGHVAVELFEVVLEAREDGVERRLVAGEVGGDELLEPGGVAVLRAPEARHLPQAGTDARALPLAVLRRQRRFQFRQHVFHPRGRAARLRSLRRGGGPRDRQLRRENQRGDEDGREFLSHRFGVTTMEVRITRGSGWLFVDR